MFPGLKMLLGTLITLLLVSCLYEGQTKKDVKIYSGAIRIHTEDPVLKDILCDAINCSDIASRQVSINISIEQEDSGIIQNSIYSLVGLTLPLIVTQSARASFKVEDSMQPEIDRIVISRGKIMHYAIMPVFAGLAGTLIGSAIEPRDFLAKSRGKCLLEKDERACTIYKEFLKNALEPIRLKLIDADNAGLIEVYYES